MKKLPTVAIVGRPNVGKSSLFNRILKRRAAVVSDREGVTRDRHFQNAYWNGYSFTLIDTGGYLVDDAIDEMADEVRAQIMTAITDADFVVFMVDVRTGITTVDELFGKLILRSQKPFLLVTNKGERPEDRLNQYEFLKLGMGDPHTISAATGWGTGDMLDKIVRHLPKIGYSEEQLIDKRKNEIWVAFLGRPNAGKSTLLNRILGEERMITSDIAGTTRDSVDCELVYHKKRIVLTDTAGLRKKARIKDEVEYFSSMRSIESVRRSDVCVVMVDATRGVEEQDYRIMTNIKDQNKGLILLLNKWDLVEKHDKTLDHLKKELINRVPELAYIPIVTISALDGQRVHRVMETVVKVYERMFKVLGRDKVAEVFQQAVENRLHPSRHLKTIHMKRACQIMVNPVVIAIETNHPDLIDESYKRYLMRRFRDAFDMEGAPMKLNFDEVLKLRKDEELEQYH